jgi:hypothetical protein
MIMEREHLQMLKIAAAEGLLSTLCEPEDNTIAALQSQVMLQRHQDAVPIVQDKDAREWDAHLLARLLLYVTGVANAKGVEAKLGAYLRLAGMALIAYEDLLQATEPGGSLEDPSMRDEPIVR